MKKNLTLVKVGGKIIENEQNLDLLIERFHELPGAKLLVHGGGRTATAIAADLGIETTMVNGRRVTDKAMLDVVTMVYGGLVNKQIVSKLQARGLNAIGLTGADGNLIQAHKREVKDVDYGFVGDVDAVDSSLLESFFKAGLVPVVAPLSHDGMGSMLNTNADTIAATCANSLAKDFDVTLYYCFEFEGVLKDSNDKSSVISKITPSVFKELLDQGIVNDGMIPKLENAFSSLQSGVKEVIITSIDCVGLNDKGTHIVLE